MAPVRVASSTPVPADEALKMLVDGNARYVSGQSPPSVEQSVRQALADDGQLPAAAVLGCADSRCPVEIMFDALPGDIFVLRNAGNTVTHNEGSIVASLEFCIGALKTKLMVVLGHTKCGAIKGAVASVPADGSTPSPSPTASALEKYLGALTPVAKQAKAELPAGASADAIATHAVKVNVFHTMERILEYSEPLRKAVASKDVKMIGAIYDIDTGKVEFLGESPRQELILDSATALQIPKTAVGA